MRKSQHLIIIKVLLYIFLFVKIKANVEEEDFGAQRSEKKICVFFGRNHERTYEGME
jgi:hypothetical protein